MPNLRGVDLSGRTFGKWTVLARNYGTSWECICECGNKSNVPSYKLVNGGSRSCGCVSGNGSRRHGMEQTSLYNTWAQMLARCNNPKSTSYKHYGAKGIKVCERWNDFRNFYADMGDKPEGKTLDRKDRTKGYEPGNVIWASWEQQNRNKPNTKMLMWKGEWLPMAQIAEMNGIPRKKFENRIRAGMSVEDAAKNIRYNQWNTPTKAVS